MRAAGFLLDVPLLGRDEAAARVLALWDPGARLYTLPDGRWLLRLGAERVVRAEQAPGSPLCGLDQALVEPGLPSGPGDRGYLVGRSGGRRVTVALAGLPVLTPASWLRVDGLPIRRLPALDAVAARAEAPIEPAPETAPDLRARAGVGRRDERAERVAAELANPRVGGRGSAGFGRAFARFGRGSARPLPHAGREPFAFLGIVASVGVVALVVGGAVAALGTVTDGRAPIALLGPVLVSAVLLWRRRSRGAPAGRYAATDPGAGKAEAPPGGGSRGGSRPRRPLARLLGAPGARLAELLMRSPLARLVVDRQERYLRDLARQFERGSYHEALRNGIALSEASAEGRRVPPALGVPRPRTGDLRPTVRVGPAGAALRAEPAMFARLRVLYTDAAERLERDDRIDEAAFALADLLGSPDAAVALYTRHGRFRNAAELAENRMTAPDLVVGLWWRAGERERAVRHARLHGAFETAIGRLTPTYPRTAAALRAEWVAACQAIGDHPGAVEAAWPDRDLRPAVAADLTAGIAQGGTIGARLLAYLATEAPIEQARSAVVAFLDADADTDVGAGGAEARDSGVEPGDRAAATEPAAGSGAGAGAGAGPIVVRADRAALDTFTSALAEMSAADPAWDRELATLAARALARAAGRPAGVIASPPGSVRRRFDALRVRADPLAAVDLRPPEEPGRGRRDRPVAVTAGDLPGRVPIRSAAALPDGTVLVACGAAGTRLFGPDGRERVRWDVPAHGIVLADHGAVALLVAERGVSRDIHRLEVLTRRIRHWATVSAREFPDSFDGAHLVTLDQGVITVLDTTTPRPRVVWREDAAPAPFLGVTRTATSCAALAQTREGAERMTELVKWRWDMPGWTLRERSTLAGTMPRSLVTGTGVVVPTVFEAVLVSGDAHLLVPSEGSASVYPGTDTDAVANIAFPGAAPDTIGFREHAGRITAWDRSGRIVVLDGTSVRAVFRT
ncbi:bpX6 domain-containing protein (plasmid) [Embleya sp. NBC_00888]|uniref:bpX6 domain-containing protein n=1 Tax=Embleya sp. NBC_00888 TaxID=2975960 RepID=UPI003865798F|nr:bpX6 domain-containing protein [Embleya sp. NBC_00888]